MRWILILAALLAVGAGPTTKPTTQPMDLQFDRDVIARAKKDVESAKEKCVERVRSTPAYRAAKAEADRLKEKLDAARTSRSATDRLVASHDFVQANERLKKVERDALAADVDVAGAREELSTAQVNLISDEQMLKLQETERADRERKKREADPVHLAKGAGRIVKGMSEEDAKGIAFKKLAGIGKFIETQREELEDGAVIVEWRRLQRSAKGDGIVTRRIRITLIQGKVVSVQDSGPTLSDQDYSN